MEVKNVKSILHAIRMALQRIQCNEKFLLIIWCSIFFIEISYLFAAMVTADICMWLNLIQLIESSLKFLEILKIAVDGLIHNLLE